MATCTIIPGKSGRMTSGVLQDGPKASEVPLYLDPDQIRRPEYKVYLHSISKRHFEQPHPIYRNVIVPACPKDRRYITFMAISHPLQRQEVDPDNVSGPSKYFFENAKRVALGVVNPSFVGADLAIQDHPIDLQYQIASHECNLLQQGVFASMNEIPTEDEIKKAETRRLTYYKQIFQRMNELWRADPKGAQAELNIDHHMAAEMFAIDVDWHKISTPKIECPNCGEKIKEGIAFHYTHGARCILDYERAWLAGAIKKEDVPEPKRWWSESSPASPAEKSKEELKEIASGLGVEVDARWSRETLMAKIREAQGI